jgi:transposase
MLSVHLDDDARADLQRLRERPLLPTKVRDRVEMVLLSAARWPPARIAGHLGYCAHTVRGVLHDYLRRGAAACTPGRTGPPPDAARRERVLGLLRGLLAEPRTWTAGQLAEALAGAGVRLGERQVRRYLRLLGAGYHRTAMSLKHKQDPARAARARRTLAGLKKKRPRAG